MLEMKVLIPNYSIADKVIQQTCDIIAKETLQTYADIVQQTPVDKGTAKGNWLVSVGYPNHSVTDKQDRGGSATISAGQAKITPESVRKGVWITNNLPYINRLEYGHSQQQPTGWIRRNIKELKIAIRNALRRLK